MSGFINIVALFLTRHAFFTCFLGHKVLLLSPFRGASDLHTFTGAIQGMYVFCMSICRCTYPDCVKNPIRQAIGITSLTARDQGVRLSNTEKAKHTNEAWLLALFFIFFLKWKEQQWHTRTDCFQISERGEKAVFVHFTPKKHSVAAGGVRSVERCEEL